MAILGYFHVIQEEIMQIGKAKHLKTCEDFGKKINENSRGLKRHTKGGIMFQVPRHLIWKQTPKNEEIDNYRCLEHMPCALSMTLAPLA